MGQNQYAFNLQSRIRGNQQIFKAGTREYFRFILILLKTVADTFILSTNLSNNWLIRKQASGSNKVNLNYLSSDVEKSFQSCWFCQPKLLWQVCQMRPTVVTFGHEPAWGNRLPVSAKWSTSALIHFITLMLEAMLLKVMTQWSQQPNWEERLFHWKGWNMTIRLHLRG